MLDFLRKRKDSLIIKFMFAIIILAFVVFFGSDTLRQGSRTETASPASVNSTDISGLKANFLIKSQLDDLKNSVSGEIPESYTSMVRGNIINALVNSETVRQDLLQLGITTAEPELKAAIKNNPQFFENGKFNTDFYLNRFRPWYQLTRGTPYESDLRDQLAVSKVVSEFESVFQFNDDEARQLNRLQNTRYRFSVIKVPKEKGVDETDPLPKEIDVNEASVSEQKDLADQVWSLFIKGDVPEDLLHENELKQAKTRELKITELKAVFDGKQDAKLIAELLKLNEKKPLPDHYFDVDNFYYLVKLDTHTPTPEPTAEELTTLKSQMAKEWSTTLESAWVRNLRNHAKIEIH